MPGRRRAGADRAVRAGEGLFRDSSGHRALILSLPRGAAGVGGGGGASSQGGSCGWISRDGIGSDGTAGFASSPCSSEAQAVRAQGSLQDTPRVGSAGGRGWRRAQPGHRSDCALSREGRGRQGAAPEGGGYRLGHRQGLPRQPHRAGAPLGPLAAGTDIRVGTSSRPHPIRDS